MAPGGVSGVGGAGAAPGFRDAAVAGLIERALSGDGLALARLISLVENDSPDLAAIQGRIYPLTGRARLLGVTGPPGVGKSTLVNRLVGAFRAGGGRVGVVAVDPTSPFTGGAILGDRVRMQERSIDPGVFIRSLATRGHLGGLSLATRDVVRLLDAAGYGTVLVETVGTGQSEVDIMDLAHTVLVVLAPGAGDDIQAQKAGILEIADILVVNKADRDGADGLVGQLQAMLDLAGGYGSGRGSDGGSGQDGSRQGGHDTGHGGHGHPWRPPIVKCVATEGRGLDELVAACAEHQAWLRGGDRLAALLRRRAASELFDLVGHTVAAEARRAAEASGLWGRLVGDLVARHIDPYAAAAVLLAAQPEVPHPVAGPRP